MDAVWKDVHVGPHSLTQTILQLRHAFAGRCVGAAIYRDGASSRLPFRCCRHRNTRIRGFPRTSVSFSRSHRLVDRPCRTPGELAAKIACVRLLSLTGPGGVGKTQLALELSRRLIEENFDEATLIDFSPLEDSADVEREIGLAFGAADAKADDNIVARVAGYCWGPSCPARARQLRARR